jgi:LacI family transcriptional regulator
MDDRGAARVATEHLIGLGHRRIGFITGSDEYALSGARLEGYRSALRDAGLPTDPELVGRGDFSFASGRAAAEALCSLAEPVTAILASNDQMSLATLHVAKSRGLAVPADLSIVSFDDTPVVRFAVPPLTAINQPIAAMTARAAELLIQANAGADPPEGPDVLPFELVVRGSTAPRGG